MLFVGGVLTTAYAQQLNSSAPLTPDTIAQLSQNVNHSVIVVMKNHYTGDAALNDQQPLMDELHQVRATHVKQFRLVNAFAATVSEGEVQRLKVNPATEQVFSDTVIRKKATQSSSSIPQAISANVSANDIPGACNATAKGQLEPESLQVTNTQSDDPTALTARSLGFTGAGVKVAWIADGVDPNNWNFLRADGTSVFADYEDFSGDGPNAQTGGAEAFLDSNSIAGQGLQVRDVSMYSAEPDDTPCNIRIGGVAPGASLFGMKAFSDFGFTTESGILQAIEYAVLTDHVDVLNESFGGNDYPDIGTQDITKLFNDAAVGLGVTVVVSSGDAGSTNTIGSPATDPAVIDAGASTTFRIYAQTNEGVARDFATTGWLDDNISALSSSGFTQTGRTIDLVAPGDLGWVSCDASSTYLDCVNDVGAPTDVLVEGGTSMSAPLTSGAAALVIQAYRSTHGGQSPSPALIKQILTSTATNLGVPGVEQGSGLLNTYRAVLLAESIGLRNATGSSLIFSQSQLNAVDSPGTPESWPVTVTNVSKSSQTVSVAGKTFGPQENVQKGTVVLNAGSPTVELWSGVVEPYARVNFNVPAGSDRLDASIAFPIGNSCCAGHLTLIDPNGKYAAYSLAQGVSGYGNVDVREPAAGTWTAVIFDDLPVVEHTAVPVLWQVYTQSFVPFGSVSSSSFTLAPGASRNLNLSATTPAAAGDADGSFVFTSTGDGTDAYVGAESNSIAVTLRSLIEPNGGGSFSGVVTGGNGRAPGEGQVAYYEFNVGSGHTSIMANVSVPDAQAPPIAAYLINPSGVAVGFGSNYSSSQPQSQPLTAYTLNPEPGLWTLIVDFTQQDYSNEYALSQPFSGNIQFDGGNASVQGLPDGGWVRLEAGVPVTVPVTVTNRGAGPETVFVDARLNSETSTPLASQFGLPGNYDYTLPLSPVNPYPVYLVPSETSSLFVSADGSVPVEFDFSPFNGDPDVLGSAVGGDKAIGFYIAPGGVVQNGYWEAIPSEIGPYPAGGAPAAETTVSMSARMKAFDPAVSSPTGDLWFYSVNAYYGGFAPVTLEPGQSQTIKVTITPSGAPGTLVSGTLYVDHWVQNLPPYGQTTGDEVAGFPYTYTIK